MAAREHGEQTLCDLDEPEHLQREVDLLRVTVRLRARARARARVRVKVGVGVGV